MYLRFDKSTTPENAAVTGLPDIDSAQQDRIVSVLTDNVSGIVDAKFIGGTLLIQPDVHVLFEETVGKIFEEIAHFFPEADINGDRREAVRAFNSCWPARVGD